MRRTRTTMLTVLLCLCLTLPSFAAEKTGQGTKRYAFQIPQHGKLILSVPAAWKQSAGEPVDIFPTIVFSPEKGDAFEVLITPLWNPRNNPDFNKPEKVRSMLEDNRRDMLPSAKEKQVSIQAFKGVDGMGYYFLLTDKAPKAGEYPYAVRAGIGVGDLLLSVTVLSRSKDSESIASTIKALQEAKQE